MSHYRWGILGAGAIAREFVRDLQSLSQAELYSVHSRTLNTARNFAKTFGFKKVYKDFDDFLSEPNLQIVYIATPNDVHAKQAIQCMEAGKHVLIEKPMAMNGTQVQEIIGTARRTNRFCMEAVWSRFIPLYREVKKLLEQDEIGEVRFLSAGFGHPITYNPKRFRFLLEKGGGSLLDLGIYPISLTLMLLGNPVQIKGDCQKADSGVDTMNRISFRYRNGAFADLRSTFNCQLSNSVWIGGSKGAVEILSPISHPDRYRLHRSKPLDFSNRKPLGISEKIKKVPGVSSVVSGFREGIIQPFKKVKRTHKVHYDGNGYRYEAQEVMGALDRGETESRIMSLQDTVDTFEIMDQLRRDWGIIFPGVD